MNAREEVLARIRTAVSGAPGPARPEVPRDYRHDGAEPAGSAVLLDLLADRLEDYRAGVHRCARDEIAGAVTGLLRERSVRRLVVPPALDPAWTAGWDGERLVDGDPPLEVGALDAADGVLTGCAVAVAETGTIVLDGSAGQGRRALTLVPDYHLVVLLADQVVRGVPEALRRLDPRRPLTWVSGPSATSDIELSRVEGVHGPRTLDVVLAGPRPAVPGGLP